MAQVVDYSWGRVGGTNTAHAQAVAAAGYVGAMRYLCYPGDGIKQLRADEVAALHAQGLAVGVVWETTADRAAQGYQAGLSDAQEANRQADALGFPADRPIYYAVDFDGSWDQVRPYFDGARAAAGRPVGIYGSYRVVEACDLGWVWQCAAWSGNGNGTAGSIQGRRASSKARLFQKVGYVLGDTCDVNDVLSTDWGGWHPDHPTTPIEEDDMPLTDTEKDEIAARTAQKVMEILTGRAQVQKMPWAFMDAEQTKPYPTLDEVVGVINLGTAVTGIKVIDSLKSGGTPAAPADVKAEAQAVADELADRLKD